MSKGQPKIKAHRAAWHRTGTAGGITRWACSCMRTTTTEGDARPPHEWHEATY